LLLSVTFWDWISIFCGYQAVLSQFSVRTFYDSDYPSTSSIYEKPLTTIDQKKIRFITPTAGQTIDLDPSIKIDLLSPDGSNKGEIHDTMLVLTELLL